MFDQFRADVENRSHPKAKFWPLMSDDELQKLADDIKANKQRLPIYETTDCKIVDGRNRYLACMIAGVDPTIETITERMYGPIESFIASMNEHRRHLGKVERNAIIKRMAKEGKSTREIAKAVGVSKSTAADISNTVQNRTVKHKSNSKPKTEPKEQIKRTGKARRLTDDEKQEIRDLKADGNSAKDIADKLGVTAATVYRQFKAESIPAVDESVVDTVLESEPIQATTEPPTAVDMVRAAVEGLSEADLASFDRWYLAWRRKHQGGRQCRTIDELMAVLDRKESDESAPEMKAIAFATHEAAGPRKPFEIAGGPQPISKGNNDAALLPENGKWYSAGIGTPKGGWTFRADESPRDAVEATLSEIIVPDDERPEKYFLRPKQAASLIRKLEKYGRPVPPESRTALELAKQRFGEDA